MEAFNLGSSHSSLLIVDGMVAAPNLGSADERCKYNCGYMDAIECRFKFSYYNERLALESPKKCKIVSGMRDALFEGVNELYQK
jgi:hypothetical protein